MSKPAQSVWVSTGPHAGKWARPCHNAPKGCANLAYSVGRSGHTPCCDECREARRLANRIAQGYVPVADVPDAPMTAQQKVYRGVRSVTLEQDVTSQHDAYADKNAPPQSVIDARAEVLREMLQTVGWSRRDAFQVKTRSGSF